MTMKNILHLLFLVSSISVFSQTGCNNEVSTDYANPSNSSLPDFNSSYFLNGFNWLAKDGGSYSKYQLDDMESNFYHFYEMDNIMSSSYPEYDYLKNNLLPLFKNGWELLGVNLGRFPNDTTVISDVYSNSLNYLPYIYLYNRYSGVIRVFVKFKGYHKVGEEVEFLKVNMSYNDYGLKSGLLRYNNGYDQALDVPSKTYDVSSIVYSPIGDTEWTSTDFKIAYDPCVCFKPSRIQIHFVRVDNSNLSINTGMFYEQLIDSATSKISPNFINGFDESENNMNQGIVMNKSVSILIQNYLMNYENSNKDKVSKNIHSEKMKTNLAVLKLIKECVIEIEGNNGITNIELTTKVRNTAISDALSYSFDKKVELFKNITSDSEVLTTNWYEIVKQMNNGLIINDINGVEIINEKEVLNYFKEIFSEKGLLFSAMNFELRNIDSLNTLPVSSTKYLEYINKNVTSTKQGVTSHLFTPGVYNSHGYNTNETFLGSHYFYPVYNDVVGVFALLKSPKIEISKKIIENETTLIQKSHIGKGGLFNTADGFIFTQNHQSWSNSYQFKLDEDIIYALNDVLDIDKYDIKCALHVKAIPKKIKTPKNVKINTFIDYQNTVNFESSSNSITSYIPVSSYGSDFNIFKHKIDTIGLYGEGSTQKIELKDIEFETPYISINAIKPFVAELSLKNEIITKKNQIIDSDDLDAYTFVENSSCDNCVSFDLSNPLIKLPQTYAPKDVGFEYEFEIKLKIMVDVDFNTVNSNNKKNSTTRMFTYDVSSYNVNFTEDNYVDNLHASSKNISKFPKDLYFNTTHFSGQDIEGCNLENSTYTCSAYNNILIGGDITAENGYSVNFNSGDSVRLINQSNLSANINLNHHSILDYSEPLGIQTQHYVNNYCLSKYKAFQKPFYYGTETDVDSDKKAEMPLSFDLFPNPASNIVSIVFEENYEKSVNILVTDLAGKIQNVEIISRADGNLSLDISNLSTGVYFISVSSNEQTKTKKLIVTNRRF